MSRRPHEYEGEYVQAVAGVPRRRRGCCLGLALLVTLAICVGFAVVLVAALRGAPNEIRTQVQVSQGSVASGDTFTIEISIENVNLDAVTITSVGLDDSLLDGFAVVSTDPPYRSVSKRDYPLLGAWHEYKLDQTLFGGDTLRVALNVQAVKQGSYSGDVTVWVEGNLLGVPFERARRDTLEFVVQ